MVRNIVIVEDIKAEVEQLSDCFARYTVERNVNFKITCFDNAEEFLDKYRPVYDIVLMDIGLPKINGLQAAARLRELDKTVMLIFVTSMAQFAAKGYEVDAFDFIVKPVKYSNFSLKLQRALNKLNMRQDTTHIITLADSLFRVSALQIKYIEISSRNLIYHTTDGSVNAYGSLNKVEADLNNKMFVRCNSCYLVNLNYVQAIHGHTVIVEGEELQISRPKRKAFIQALNDYLGGGI